MRVVVDWSGHDGMATSRRYRAMAERQLRGVSPSYERLCLGVADDADLIARLDSLPAPKRQPNLLLASVRFLDGPVDELSGVPRVRPVALGRRVGDDAGTAHTDERTATMRDAAARAGRVAATAGVARSGRVSRAVPVPRPVRVPVQRRRAARLVPGGVRLPCNRSDARYRRRCRRSCGVAGSTSIRSMSATTRTCGG